METGDATGNLPVAPKIRAVIGYSPYLLHHHNLWAC